MSTIFIGGSRKVSRLPELARSRLDNIITGRHRIIVGDAAGADKAVQTFLAKVGYQDVTVFCSGTSCRNNVGEWSTRMINASPVSRGFQFYAAKDRVMAREADFGLMIWDGKSPGTALNVLRLINAGRKTVMLDVSQQRTITFNGRPDWDDFIAQRDSVFRGQLVNRATDEEWSFAREPA